MAEGAPDRADHRGGGRHLARPGCALALVVVRLRVRVRSVAVDRPAGVLLGALRPAATSPVAGAQPERGALCMPGRTQCTALTAAPVDSAAGPGPPLALMHGLNPGDRDGVALRDQVSREPLRRGQLAPPPGSGMISRAAVRTVIGRRHPVQFVPGQREGHPGPRAGSGGCRPPPRWRRPPGRVEEDLPLPVFPDEGGGGAHRVELLGPGCHRAGGRRGVFGRGLRDRHEDVHPLRAAGLDRARQPAAGQGLADQLVAWIASRNSPPDGGSMSSTR